MNRARVVANLLLRKHAGAALSVLKGIAKAPHAAGQSIAEGIRRAGGGPVAEALGYAAPAMATAYGAKRVYESEPVRRVRYKLREMKYKRQMKEALRRQQGR